jgi:hypothetical protein
MLKRLLAFLVLIVPAPVRAQVACAATFDSLVARIEQNYAGYQLEVTGARPTQYRAMVASLRRAAGRADVSHCYQTLAELTAWFDDPHLFVYQSARLDSSETRRRMAAVGHLPVNEAVLRADLARRGKQLDPIEGIWYDRGLRVAIVPAPDKGPRHFLAVVLTSDTLTWAPGDIRARLARTSAGHYDVELSERNYALRHLRGTLHRRVLLRLSPGIWGKEFPLLPADSGSLDPGDAHRATWQARAESNVLSIPSHDPTYLPALQAIGVAHDRDLRDTRFLIIDLRGNEGGSSWMTLPLVPYLASVPRRSSPYDTGTAVMLSSPLQIAYAKRGFGSDTSAFVRSLVRRLEAAPGALVPLTEPGRDRSPEAIDSVIQGPRRVAVLIDRGTVSASEVLVLAALRSTRAIVIGEPTAGALDYQSVNVVRLSPSEDRWFLGYPTVTRHAGLPVGGMRGKGIAPDVVVKWDEVADPMAVVEEILRKRP